jgi:hypothetical protein
MPSVPYYYRSSPGIGTNLQFYSLRQAWRCWRDLSSQKDKLGEGKIRERCVLTVVLLGLSLSQLLGQNTPLTSGSILPPIKLLSLFLNQTDISDTKKESLNSRFREFMNAYDACRHFGPSKYQKIENLDLKATESFFNLTIEIWDIVIGHFEVGQDIFKSICEILDESNEDEEYL